MAHVDLVCPNSSAGGLGVQKLPLKERKWSIVPTYREGARQRLLAPDIGTLEPASNLRPAFIGRSSIAARLKGFWNVFDCSKAPNCFYDANGRRSEGLQRIFVLKKSILGLDCAGPLPQVQLFGQIQPRPRSGLAANGANVWTSTPLLRTAPDAVLTKPAGNATHSSALSCMLEDEGRSPGFRRRSSTRKHAQRTPFDKRKAERGNAFHSGILTYVKSVLYVGLFSRFSQEEHLHANFNSAKQSKQYSGVSSLVPAHSFQIKEWSKGKRHSLRHVRVHAVRQVQPLILTLEDEHLHAEVDAAPQVELAGRQVHLASVQLRDGCGLVRGQRKEQEWFCDLDCHHRVVMPGSCMKSRWREWL